MITASSILCSFHWLVWQNDYSWYTDLPQLQTVRLGDSTFEDSHSVVFESECWCWSSYLDLPKLLSIQLGSSVFRGDDSNGKREKQKGSYKWQNTLTMRSDSYWDDVCIDLDLLKEMKGKENNFVYFGSVSLRSIDLHIDRHRHNSVAIWRNSIWCQKLQKRSFGSVIKYLFPLFMIIRCKCYWFIH